MYKITGNFECEKELGFLDQLLEQFVITIIFFWHISNNYENLLLNL